MHDPHNGHGGHDGHDGHNHDMKFTDILAQHLTLAQFRDAFNKYYAQSEPAPKAVPMARPTAQMAARTAAGTAAAVTAAPLIRRGQHTLTDEEKDAFLNALASMCGDSPADLAQSTYGQLVAVHQSNHNMHTMGLKTAAGTLRFLPWHRQFLLEFERRFIQADQALRPNAQRPLAVPYWRWQDDFPDWLEGKFPFTAGVPAPVLVRAEQNTPAASKPTLTEVKAILGASESMAGQGMGPYELFTYAMEGFATDRRGKLIDGHNSVHAWVGGFMGVMNMMTLSPVDPIFWLVHSEVDRLWDIWSAKHPGIGPALSGADQTMDPWPALSTDLLDITTLGYTYDSSAP